MLVRLFGALFGAWPWDEAFARDLFVDASGALDRAASRSIELPGAVPDG